MDDLAQYLIARVLPDAYTPRPGQPAPRYSEQQAHQVLSFLARQMNQDHTRDLAWWQIPRWAPTRPRILASMLVGGLLGGFLGALLSTLPVGLEFLLVDVRGVMLRLGLPWTEELAASMVLGGLTFGLGLGLALGFGYGRGDHEPKRIRNWRAISLRSVLTAGVAYGLLVALAILLVRPLAGGLMFVFVLGVFPDAIKDTLFVTWLVSWLVGWFVGGLTVGLPLGLKRHLLGGLGEGKGSPQKLTTSQRNNRLAGLGGGIKFGLVFGLLYGLVGGLAVGLLFGLVFGLLFGLVGGLAVWLLFGLVPRLAGGFVAGFAEDEGSPQGPFETWRNDRVFGLVTGLAFGLAFGLANGLTGWYEFVVDPASRLQVGLGPALALAVVHGLAYGLAVGLVYGITSSVTWSTTLAWLQLRRSHQVPAVGLMSFLEDARDRGVLRTVGAVYQFRHATLQDQLARQTTSSPPSSSETRCPS